MNRYFDTEQDYYLDCGCWSGQNDHTCMGGRRPSYCRCGAPDDCYCPSPAELLENMLNDTAFPAVLNIDGTKWMTYNVNQTISVVLDHDDADRIFIRDNDNAEWPLT